MSATTPADSFTQSIPFLVRYEPSDIQGSIQSTPQAISQHSHAMIDMVYLGFELLEVTCFDGASNAYNVAFDLDLSSRIAEVLNRLPITPARQPTTNEPRHIIAPSHR